MKADWFTIIKKCASNKQKNENEGEILSLSQIYANKGIEFKIFQIEVDETPEVYIDSMSIPEEISVGDVFSIDITIDSNISTEATLYLYQGRTL